MGEHCMVQGQANTAIKSSSISQPQGQLKMHNCPPTVTGCKFKLYSRDTMSLVKLPSVVVDHLYLNKSVMQSSDDYSGILHQTFSYRQVSHEQAHRAFLQEQFMRWHTVLC